MSPLPKRQGKHGPEDDYLAEFRRLMHTDRVAASLFLRANRRAIEKQMDEDERGARTAAKASQLSEIDQIEARGFTELATYERLKLTGGNSAGYYLSNRAKIGMQRTEFERATNTNDDEPGPEAA